MGRSRIRIVWALAFALALGAAPVSAEAAVEGGAIQKLTRGFLNVVTGWLEIPAQVGRATELKGSFAGATEGLARGVVLGLGRTVVGALELVTFPIPNPVTGYGPVIEPEFVTLRDADRR